MTAQLDAVAREADEHVCPLPHIPEAVSVVRRRVRTVLADWNLAPDLAEDALLVISELITNAVVHALPPAVLRLSRVVDGSHALRVEVTDAGAAAAERRPVVEPDADEHGRGLDIVTALAAECGTRVHAGGITWWAKLLAA
ncbi:ATP-binding protein [Streptomyces sp. Je 1-4]|uniref:ATP-binding protein n=1 Tax=Streptomyces TaxID=1883 RepID=UPI00140EF569|nr:MULTISPECIES: ATP-binding protein [unclassified Streptomyces]QIK06777.1 ATP-binding protein [Streptomyces sp. ID38640]UYB40141.1 ATP-binding protein [Streptomyces sp. Je 1-4]UZQ36232.1 ATP-binding protein [Streptomyces sp. Je 1-4] [Streptomyces sp. Je 1-4 4N24]UZQ43650.1 ATP-binding protein [Streptomyces sp. Je 1-4] [Streptomyces sp. Je 1-4 4N24_ara]